MKIEDTRTENAKAEETRVEDAKVINTRAEDAKVKNVSTKKQGSKTRDPEMPKIERQKMRGQESKIHGQKKRE